MPFLVHLLSDDARLPVRGTEGSVGYDLSSAKEMCILARSQALVPTDISIQFPEGFYGQIASRSGLALKNSIHVGAGIIDSDYRGPIGVLLVNLSETNDFKINRGDRIAQLILHPVALFEVEKGKRGKQQEEKNEETEKRETSEKQESESRGGKVLCTIERGSKGFGSTGLNREAET